MLAHVFLQHFSRMHSHQCSAAACLLAARRMPDEPMQGRFIPETLAGDNAEAAAAVGGAWRLALAVLLPIVAIAFIVVAAAAYARHSLDRLVDLLGWQRKRAHGCPAHGPVSIVVTDIEGYSELMASAPSEMAQVRKMTGAACADALHAALGVLCAQ